MADNVDLTSLTCKQYFSNILTGINCSWKQQLIEALCTAYSIPTELTCEQVHNCETITSLSEFTSEDGTICIDFTDETGTIFTRCFELDDSEITITADNGLIKDTPTNVQLGGTQSVPATLVHDTYIENDGFTFNFEGLTLLDGGQINFNQYGVGNFQDTGVYLLGVDASGNVIETLAPEEVLITADNGLSKNTPSNVQLGGPVGDPSELLDDRFISNDFNIAIQNGTLSVGVDDAGPAKIWAKGVGYDITGSIYGLIERAVTGSSGIGTGVSARYNITGGTSYAGGGPIAGLYGELSFTNSGSWAYTGGNHVTQLAGLNGVFTIYTNDASNYNAGASTFAGGQYNIHAAGTGTISSFACLRALEPQVTPGLGFAGTITNHYGLLIEDMAASTIAARVTNKYGIYQKGLTEKNIFIGHTAFGADVVTGTRVDVVDNALTIGQKMVNMTSSSTANAILLNLSATGSMAGIVSTTAGQVAVTATSTTATALVGNSTSGGGVSATSVSNYAGTYTVIPSSTNTIVPVILLNRASSGTAANGIGSSIQLSQQCITGGSTVANELQSKWTDATLATRTSEFSITGVNNAATQTLLTISGAGIFTLVQGLQNFANDAAAAIGNIPVNGLYRNGSVVQIRVS